MAAVIAVGGLLCAVAWAALGTVAGTSDLARAALPARVTVQVSEPGSLVVYYEGEPVLSLAHLNLAVPGPGGTSVPVRGYGHDIQYDSATRPGVPGRAVAKFEAIGPGQYTIASTYERPGLAHLAADENISAGFIQRMLGPLLLAVGTVLLAIVVSVNTKVRRARRGWPSPTMT